MQDEKSQLQNREKAMKVLRARLYEAKLAEQQAELAAERRAQVGTGERAEKIRTYNFPERRVTDHRVKLTVHNLEEVLAGELDEHHRRAAGRREARAARSGDLMARRLLGPHAVRDALDSRGHRARRRRAATRRGSTPSCCSPTCWGSTAPRSSPTPGARARAGRRRARSWTSRARRREREPVAYILGDKGFRQIELHVDPRVLVPRPETEHVVEAALALPQGARVVDVGHRLRRDRAGAEGRAAGPRGVRHRHRPPARSTSRARNAARLGLDVEFVARRPARRAATLDAVVANPPYVADDGDRLRPTSRATSRARRSSAATTGSTSSAGSRRRRSPRAASLALEVGAGQARRGRGDLLRGAASRDGAVRDLPGIERVVRPC